MTDAPDPEKSYSWFRVVILIISIQMGCGGPTSPPASPPVAKFDPNDADSTFRWLATQGKAMRNGAKLKVAERSVNPLSHSGSDAAFEEFRRIRDDLGPRFRGQKVLWRARVERITEDSVWIYFDPHEVVEDGVTGKAWCSDNETPGKVPNVMDGILKVDEGISYKQAAQLRPGGPIMISAIVDAFEPRWTEDKDGVVTAMVEIYLKDCKTVPF